MYILMSQVSLAQESIASVIHQGDGGHTLSLLPESPARGIIPNFYLRHRWTCSAYTGGYRERSEAFSFLRLFFLAFMLLVDSG